MKKDLKPPNRTYLTPEQHKRFWEYWGSLGREETLIKLGELMENSNKSNKL